NITKNQSAQGRPVALNADGTGRNWSILCQYNSLPPRIGPPVRRVQNRENGASLSALPDLTRAGQELRLATAQSMDGDQHELAVERLDDLGSFQGDGVVGEELVEAQRRRPRRRLHPVPHRIRSLLLRFGVLPLERELDPDDDPLGAGPRPHLQPLKHYDPPLR